MLLKKKIPSNALKISAIFLVSSCTGFDWKPRPYVGDSVNQQIINVNGETIKTDQPAFDEFTCFDAENIAELKSAIDQTRNKRTRKRLNESFITAFPGYK